MSSTLPRPPGKRTLARNRAVPCIDVSAPIHRPASAHSWANQEALGLYLGVVLAMILGGSARADVDSLMVLYPVAVLLLGLGLWHIGRVRWCLYQPHLVFAAVVIGFVALQEIPLPPVVWENLPGRLPIVAIDEASGLGHIWRPFTMTPLATWNSLCFLVLPIAVLLLGAIASVRSRKRLLECWLVLGALSALLGVAQILLPANESYSYLYDVTNRGAGVGLFANRNHQAVLLDCMIPMLAVWASRRNGSHRARQIRRYGAGAAILLLVPILLVTGSRSGFLLGVLAVGSVPFIYRPAHDRGFKILLLKRRRVSQGFVLTLLCAALAVALGAMSLVRVEALTRLANAGVIDAERWQVLFLTLHAAGDYFPWGAGTGGFAQVIQLHERAELLSTQYFNQAHDDLADLWLTAGIPGCVLLAVAMAGYARALIRALRFTRQDLGTPDRRLYRAGVMIVTIIGLASLSDYPLRTPAIACLFVTALLWLPLQKQGPFGDLADVDAPAWKAES